MFDEDMSVEEQVARRVLSDMDPLAKRVKEMSGQPFGVPNLTPEQELWAWNHHDDAINVEQMRASGIPDTEIAVHYFPLRSHLMDQAGRTFDEQAAYARRMEERRLKAEQAGRTPKPPERSGGLAQKPFVPIEED